MPEENTQTLASRPAQENFEGASDTRNVLIIEDDPMARKLLRVVIESEGWNVIDAEKGRVGLAKLAKAQPDVVILDLGLPDMDGREVLRRLREWSDIPVLILSSHEEIDDKVDALDCGAQDYVTKPFNAKELLARLRVAFRSKPSKPEPSFDHGDLHIDFSARIVTVAGKTLHFTPIEYSILRVLAKNKGCFVPKTYIKKLIWGNVISSTDDQLRVHMSSLRKKLKEAGMDGVIKTENGVGYMI